MTRQLKDGEAFMVKDTGIVRDVCCRCGLAHQVQYTIRGGEVEVKTFVDTQYMRRAEKRTGRPA